MDFGVFFIGLNERRLLTFLLPDVFRAFDFDLFDRSRESFYRELPLLVEYSGTGGVDFK